jgi:hypothetical protein
MNIHDEIKKIHTNVSTVIYNNDGSYTLLDENGNTITPDTDAINAKQVEVNNTYQAKQYARDRVSEYPPIGDQLDALFHAGVFPQEMADKIQAVKNKYPKGSE